MTLLQHVVYKLSSARWVWAVTSAGVFAWLACTGKIDPKDVIVIISMVIGYYFGKSGGKKEGEP